MHMCTTMGLGGLSSHDASFAYWNSLRIEMVAIVFMALAGISFARYFIVWRSRSLGSLAGDAEVRAYFTVLAAAIVVLSLLLAAQGTYASFPEALRAAAFQWCRWPPPRLFVHRLRAVAGVCAGAAGVPGLLCVLCGFHRRRHQDGPHDHAGQAGAPRAGAHHPPARGQPRDPQRAQHPVQRDRRRHGLHADLRRKHRGPVHAHAGVRAGCGDSVLGRHRLRQQHRPGPGAGGPGVHLWCADDFQTWICTFAMLLGRLELLAVLVLFTSQFWRK
jgi:trk system potassium uptake protein TrkH